jgi:hypothetical protein
MNRFDPGGANWRKERSMLSEKPSKDEIYKLIGTLLIATQWVEQIINDCLGSVIRFLQIATIDELYVPNEKKKYKKTLGQLLKLLRERVSIEPSFDSLLKSFLMNRNTFAHRMLSLPGWTLETEAGRQVAIEFLERYREELTQVNRIFTAFVREDSRGLQIPIPHGSESFIAMVDKHYVPLVPFLATDLQEPKKKKRPRKKRYRFRGHGRLSGNGHQIPEASRPRRSWS